MIYTFKDICTKIGSGATPSGGKEAYKGGEYALVRSQNVLDYTFTTTGLAYINELQAKKLDGVKVESGDVLLNITGDSVARACIIPNEILPARVNQHVAIIRGNRKVVLNEYLLYFLQYNKQLLLSISQGGGTRSAITKKMIEDLEIDLPSIKEQEKVVSLLKSIDHKIELNRQINDNLEQQAQALYKSWFVDFEPFKDGEFMDSELGLIPEGWQVGTYEQIIQTTISGDWGKDVITGNYTHKVACVRGCDFQDMSIGVRGKTPERYILEKNYQAKRLIDNDVIVEISGGTSTISTGRVCLINADLLGKYNHDIVCTNFCKVARPVQSYGAYLYYSWKYKYDCRVMFGYENGTSGIKNFQISDFLGKEPVIIPSGSSIKAFQTIIETLQNNIQTNGSEIMKLEALRDTLLPKLMSGELKINDLDC